MNKIPAFSLLDLQHMMWNQTQTQGVWFQNYLKGRK